MRISDGCIHHTSCHSRVRAIQRCGARAVIRLRHCATKKPQPPRPTVGYPHGRRATSPTPRCASPAPRALGPTCSYAFVGARPPPTFEGGPALPHAACKGFQLLPRASREAEGIPKATSGYQRLPRASRGVQGLARACKGIKGLPRASSRGVQGQGLPGVAASDIHKLPRTPEGFQRLPEDSRGCLRLWVAFSDFEGLPRASKLLQKRPRASKGFQGPPRASKVSRAHGLPKVPRASIGLRRAFRGAAPPEPECRNPGDPIVCRWPLADALAWQRLL